MVRVAIICVVALICTASAFPHWGQSREGQESIVSKVRYIVRSTSYQSFGKFGGR